MAAPPVEAVVEVVEAVEAMDLEPVLEVMVQ
jgi:hypothetical protein